MLRVCLCIFKGLNNGFCVIFEELAEEWESKQWGGSLTDSGPSSTGEEPVEPDILLKTQLLLDFH